VRAEVRANAWNQAQVTDASHLIAIAYRTDMTPEDVDAYIADIIKTRGVTAESVEGFRAMMLGTIEKLSPQEKAQWNARQSYLALGFVLMALAEMQIDSCPMEGFDGEKVSDILGATAEGYTVATLLPIGHRSAEDETAQWPKVRYPEERVVKRV
jgi:nitroreductase